MNKEEMTIEELERELEQELNIPSALQPLIPPGFRPHMTLYGPERKMKKNASARKWSPESGEIRIRFEANQSESEKLPPADAKKFRKIEDEFNEVMKRREGKRDEAAASSKPNAKPPELPKVEARSGPLQKQAITAPDPLSDLIRALDRAESRPGFDFVALKWFRDVALLQEGFAWVQSDTARHTLLRDAIEKRLILTSRIANPRSPQFPVTSIRLNRLLPEVQAILGTSGQGGEDFNPVEIRGESLSTTILRERR